MDSQRQNADVGFRADINGLRAFAVTTVMLFHFDVPGFAGGFVGVDVFFVISGFLMTRLIVGKLERGDFSILNFYLARAIRIVPALLALTATMLVFGWLSLDPEHYGQLAQEIGASLSFTSNFLFWQQAGYFDVASHEKWLLHTWSLSVEWQFYLLLPIALLAAWKLFGSRRGLLLALSTACVLSLAFSIVITPKRPDLSYFLLPSRAWEMMAGGVLCLIGQRTSCRRSLSRWLEVAGIGLIFGAAALLDSSAAWPGYLAVIPVLGTALVIFAAHRSSLLTANPLCNLIGRISYSAYLWHWPVVVCLYYLQVVDRPLWIVLAIALSLLLGYLSYVLVEEPSRSRASRWSLAAATMWLATPSAVLIIAGIVVFKTEGMPVRLGEDLSLYTAIEEARHDSKIPTATECDKRMIAVVCDRTGTNGSIMFIGDSVVEEELYVRYGKIDRSIERARLFITHRGCLPIPNLRGCEEFAELAWSEVHRRKPQKLVIASQWWLTFFYPSGGMRASTCVQGPTGCVPVDSHEKLLAAFAPFEDQVRKTIEGGTDVIILGPVPISPIDYGLMRSVDLSARHLALPLAKSWEHNVWEKDGILDSRTASAELALKSNPPSFQFATDLSAPPHVLGAILKDIGARSGAQVLSPEEYLCTNGRCPLADQFGIPLYVDTIHLRREYVCSNSMQWLDRALLIQPTPVTFVGAVPSHGS
ncbi:MAG: acyltransferase family protein [Steroidobacteraceae bacterium]